MNTQDDLTSEGELLLETLKQIQDIKTFITNSKNQGLHDNVEYQQSRLQTASELADEITTRIKNILPTNK